MKKIIQYVICTGVIASALALYKLIPNVKADSILLANVEALSQDSEQTIHIWCCGTKDVCAKGEYIRIKGKFSNEPCK